METPTLSSALRGNFAFSLCSPAKINRFLHIVGRRKSDGYHLLQTLFQFLDYSDSLRFEAREDTLIVIDPDEVMGIALENNLIYRAAIALQEASPIKQGATIYIEKNIPLGTGLGGGSSNAATTLVGLNFLWGLEWSLGQLAQLGVTLGADIPIFLHGQAAWGEGIGEKLTSAELDEPWVVVIIPSCQVATAKIYGDPDLTRNTPTFRIEALAKEEIKKLLGKLNNDFEPLVRQRYRQVDEAIKWLSDYGKARLSGSGASVFACFSSLEEATEVIEHLPTYFNGFIAKGKNKSPLMESAEKLGFQFKDWGVAKR